MGLRTRGHNEPGGFPRNSNSTHSNVKHSQLFGNVPSFTHEFRWGTTELNRRLFFGNFFLVFSFHPFDIQRNLATGHFIEKS